MYASIHRFTGVQGTPPEVLRLGNQLAVALSRCSGFVSYALLEVDGQVDLSIVEFETETDLTAANQFAERWVVEQHAGWLTSPQQTTTGEIIVQWGM